MTNQEKITIYPVTRIEGHAKITIHLDEKKKISKVLFHVDQFRGFEKFIEGRYFEEAPIITAKICGICPVSHILGAVKAGDMIMNVQIPYTAKLLRMLAHLGQIIQSHCLHFFYLASPDLLLGWNADPAIRNVAGLVEKYPDFAMKGIKLRKFGQTIIEYVGGARINPKNFIPGGIAAPLDPKHRDIIIFQIDEMISYCLEGLEFIKHYIEKNKLFVERYANFKTNFLGLVNDGNWEVYDGKIKVIDQNGNLLYHFDSVDYNSYIAEYIEDWSYLKFPFLKKLGYPEGVYRVGPLARLNVSDRLPTPLAEREFMIFKQIGNPIHESFYYHYARMIEVLHSLERVREILLDPEILSKDVFVKGRVENEQGIGIIEAPRGTLIHHYWVDEKGKITKCNMIVASGNNNWAMSKAAELIAREFLDPEDIKEEQLNLIEGGIRCYDPCLSCSTHAIGQMPIRIEVYDHKSQLLNVFQRE
ncbi:MAG: Ni/Fe hydrogenase subunit alpha [Candidatus Calescibacterium sp.]|nr:Ni/Fe hydrogenase subunit alpha [Candidatus Calescibacterium sp.]MCX7971618.1 Ni/Fe hydrogenase subunit alpha [bacterium]MDW8195826.1 Ni/Fe hydrogenase subunit alpha [Candidatus Calescibacterium sp.]